MNTGYDLHRIFHIGCLQQSLNSSRKHCKSNNSICDSCISRSSQFYTLVEKNQQNKTVTCSYSCDGLLVCYLMGFIVETSPFVSDIPDSGFLAEKA